MILKRFYDDKLAQASYLIGCAATGEAAVIDPNRDVDQYQAAAAEEGLRIVAVTETHIHADFLSGSRELADRTGARMFLSDEGDATWKYAFADQANVTLVRDGDHFRVGNLRMDVVATPGHTPEHITFVLTDEAASDVPLGAFTGDFIFVGDVGRPDLLERAAGFEGTMVAGAGVLHASLEKFLARFPDTLLIWPAHGAGSACGKSLGGVPVSTLGYEKSANWGLKIREREAFTKAVLGGQPEPPFYFKEMKRLNKIGPAIRDGFRIPPRLGPTQVFELLEHEAVLVDLRSPGTAALGSIPGSVLIPYERGFTVRAGWLLPYDAPITLIGETQSQVAAAVLDLQMIGLDNVVGWFGPEVFRIYENRFGDLPLTPQVDVKTLGGQVARDEVTVVDVRGLTEYAAGHIPGAIHVPIGFLERERARIPDDKPIVVHCAGGCRAPVAASVLRRMGFAQPTVFHAGFPSYRDAGYEVALGEPVGATAGASEPNSAR